MVQTTNSAGGCLCGAVRYEISGPLRPVVYCHCGQCHQWSGNFVAATACASDDLVMLAEDGLRWYASSSFADRGFCRECGSSLFWRGKSRDHISIMAGSIDTPSGLEAAAHIFVTGKSEFLTIADELPQYDHSPPSEVTAVDE